eukprot:SAG31_NODE_47_length_30979_cov_41.708841_17_plen_168_part_00
MVGCLGRRSGGCAFFSTRGGRRGALDAIEERLDYDAAHRYVHGDIFKAGAPKCTDGDYFEKGGDRNFQLVTTGAPTAPREIVRRRSGPAKAWRVLDRVCHGMANISRARSGLIRSLSRSLPPCSVATAVRASLQSSILSSIQHRPALRVSSAANTALRYTLGRRIEY